MRACSAGNSSLQTVAKSASRIVTSRSVRSPLSWVSSRNSHLATRFATQLGGTAQYKKG
jgi:hypothetical protein